MNVGGGQLTIAVDGGPALGHITVGNSGKMLTQSLDLPLAFRSSVSVISASGNAAEIEGASFSNTATAAVRVFNAGVSGAESSVVGDGVTPGAGIISSAAALHADLALINFGINDILQGNLTAAQTTANIALIVTEFRANGTVRIST